MTQSDNSAEKWERVIKQIHATLGQEVFNSWFGRLKLETTSGGVALHSVPTAFLKTWIKKIDDTREI